MYKGPEVDHLQRAVDAVKRALLGKKNSEPEPEPDEEPDEEIDERDRSK